MKRWIRTPWRAAIVASLLTASLIAGGIAFAEISPDGTVHACIVKATRLLRVPAAGASCTSQEYSVSWNQKGQPGPAGPAGTWDCAEELRFAAAAKDLDVRHDCLPDALESRGDAGSGLALYQGTDGTATVVYRMSDTDGALITRMIRCVSSGCANSPTTNGNLAPFTGSSDLGAPLLQSAASGFPLRIDWISGGGVTECTAADCATSRTYGIPVTLADTGNVRTSSGPGGLQRFFVSGRVINCDSAACHAPSSQNISGFIFNPDPNPDSIPGSGWSDAEGGVVFAARLSNGDTILQVRSRSANSIYRCADPCAQVTKLGSFDRDGNVDQATSTVVGDRLVTAGPKSGTDSTTLTVTSCNNAQCSALTRNDVATNAKAASIVSTGTGVWLLYYGSNGELTAKNCPDPTCGSGTTTVLAPANRAQLAAVGVAGGRGFATWQDPLYTAVHVQAL